RGGPARGGGVAGWRGPRYARGTQGARTLGVTLACGVGVGARGGARAPARVRVRTLGGTLACGIGGGARGGAGRQRAAGGGRRGEAVGGVASWVYVLWRRG